MENIVEKINLILKAKNISARQFAEEIGVQPSGMSHILSGRNNPSLDFVMKVVRRYPEIDIKWLMFGQGEMIVGTHPNITNVPKTPTPTPAPAVVESVTMPIKPTPTMVNQPQAPVPSTITQSTSPKKSTTARVKEAPAPTMDLFSQLNENRVNEEPVAPVQEYQNVGASPMMDIDTAALASTVVAATPKTKHVVRLLAFYDDHTFAEFLPE